MDKLHLCNYCGNAPMAECDAHTGDIIWGPELTDDNVIQCELYVASTEAQINAIKETIRINTEANMNKPVEVTNPFLIPVILVIRLLTKIVNKFNRYMEKRHGNSNS